jgi:MFS family permease
VREDNPLTGLAAQSPNAILNGARGGQGPRWGTRLAFIISGFVLGIWSAVVPFAKLRVGANDAQIGFLILCMGLGSILLMPVTGLIASRRGGRPVIIGASLLIATVPPFLALASLQIELGVGLFVLGAAIGSLDVAMNAHAIEVEQAAGRPLMSGFHACYSIGGFAGAGAAAGLFSLGASTLEVLSTTSLVTLFLTMTMAPRLLQIHVEQSGIQLTWPKGVVLLLTALAATAYLTEGAILDWSALLVGSRHVVAITHAGLAYMLFSMGMTVGRLTGDEIGLRFGRKNVLQWGGASAAAGLALALLSSNAELVLFGFCLAGLGASNIVPFLFSQAGHQRVMPSGMAIAVITSVSYGATLAGPGLVGLLASSIGLANAFWLFVVLMLAVAVGSRYAIR